MYTKGFCYITNVFNISTDNLLFFSKCNNHHYSLCNNSVNILYEIRQYYFYIIFMIIYIKTMKLII